MAAALADPGERERLLAANARDVAAAKAAAAAGELDPARLKRLGLDAAKLGSVADGLAQLADRPELLGRPRLRRELDDGLVLEQVPCPLGLVGVVFEARPDAAPQIGGLCLKSGNAALLKGGSEARESNRALVELMQRALQRHGVAPAAITLLEQREDITAMLALDGVLDLVIARGGHEFVRHVQRSTQIAVMGHAEGVCHLFLHASAEPAMAATIAADAKCGYPAACNAIEALLWEGGAEAALDACVAALRERGVELRGCDRTRARHPSWRPRASRIGATSTGRWCWRSGASTMKRTRSPTSTDTGRSTPRRSWRPTRPQPRVPRGGRRRRRVLEREHPLRRRLSLRARRGGRYLDR
ncbi:hypothetical protein OV079_32630 [Nannocystis pusilla]|uniref:Glutamate-5-semialdehyde dehydrogenase n=1 Tax=Nannocystis pusilla TaxID=889268 RepID=A0A9X3F2I0_9BACT|nr:hypothetical protein [Nannocystis pusilla]MCY1010233.1 hypothetical protein [Nannocystis pusilla]